MQLPAPLPMLPSLPAQLPALPAPLPPQPLRVASYESDSSDGFSYSSKSDDDVHGSRSEQPTQESPLRPVLHAVRAT